MSLTEKILKYKMWIDEFVLYLTPGTKDIFDLDPKTNTKLDILDRISERKNDIMHEIYLLDRYSKIIKGKE